jgi:hypothetical protein
MTPPKPPRSPNIKKFKAMAPTLTKTILEEIKEE